MSKNDEIILIYKGKLPQRIQGVPARDLNAEDIKRVAQAWDKSTTETEGLLISRKLYAFAYGTPKETRAKAAEAATEILENEEV